MSSARFCFGCGPGGSVVRGGLAKGSESIDGRIDVVVVFVLVFCAGSGSEDWACPGELVNSIGSTTALGLRLKVLRNAGRWQLVVFGLVANGGRGGKDSLRLFVRRSSVMIGPSSKLSKGSLLGTAAEVCFGALVVTGRMSGEGLEEMRSITSRVISRQSNRPRWKTIATVTRRCDPV